MDQPESDSMFIQFQQTAHPSDELPDTSIASAIILELTHSGLVLLHGIESQPIQYEDWHAALFAHCPQYTQGFAAYISQAIAASRPHESDTTSGTDDDDDASPVYSGYASPSHS